MCRSKGKLFINLYGTIVLSVVAITTTKAYLIGREANVNSDQPLPNIPLEYRSHSSDFIRHASHLQKRFARSYITNPPPLDNTSEDSPDEITPTMEYFMYLSMNSTETAAVNSTSAWRVTFDTAELVMTSIGIVANFVTFIALGRQLEGISTTIRILLIHQSVIDCMVSETMSYDFHMQL